jgi:hypothetical protein
MRRVCGVGRWVGKVEGRGRGDKHTGCPPGGSNHGKMNVCVCARVWVRAQDAVRYRSNQNQNQKEGAEMGGRWRWMDMVR